MNTDTILYICGFIVSVDAVADIVLKFKKRAESPTKTLEERVAKLENEQEKIQGFLARDKARLDGVDQGMAILHESVLALVDHALDSSNIEPLLSAKKDLNSYLVGKSTKPAI